VNVGFQRSIRREFGHPEFPQLAALYLVLNTTSYDVKLHLPGSHGWEPTIGLNGMYQVNDASKGTELVVPSYRNFDIGPFLHAKRSFGVFDVSAGVRYDVRDFRNSAMYTRVDPITGFNVATSGRSDDSTLVRQFDTYQHTFSGISASGGLAFNASERITLKANIARGYRAPNAAEISAKGVHPGTGYEQLGDADLRPEFNLQQDVGVFFNGTHVSGSAELFNNDISDYIYNEKLVGMNGSDSLFTQGGVEYPVFKFRQTRARLFGGEISLDIHPHPYDWLHVENSLSFVIAENKGGNGARITDGTRYLPLIPPLHTNTELRADLRKRFGCFAEAFVKVGVQVYAAQARFYGAYGTETGTPGYWLIDAGVGGNVLDKKGGTLFSFSVLGTNLADLAYQSNMNRLKYFDDYPVNGTGRSGIFNMGRNISLKLVVPFAVKKEKEM
jgi:iron complex outermembrane receptor protein